MEKKDKNITDLVSKWIDNSISAEDEKAMRAHPEFPFYASLFEKLDQIATPSFDTESGYERLQIKKAQLDQTTSSEKVQQAKVFSINRRIITIAIAASFVLFFGVRYFIQDPITLYSTNIGEQIEVELPDGSVAVLNAKSALSFKAKNWKEKRLVALSGEAYFKVAKGSKFSVETDLGDVEVLGTEFNVYQFGENLDVQCYEGKVSVLANERDHIIEAGNAVKITVEGLANYQIDLEVPSWQMNYSEFDSIPLDIVFQEFERFYPNTIKLLSNGNARFTGRFVHDDLEKSLDMICLPMQLKYSINREGEITIQED